MNPSQIQDRSGGSRAMAIALVCMFVAAVGGALWASTLLATGSADGDLETRRARIAGMTAAEKEHLGANQKLFAKLDEKEREKLRALYAAIEHDPRRDELERVMMRYRQWLRELTPEDRASLLTTDVSERLVVVQSLQEKLHQRYLAEAGKEMTKEDADAVRDWMDEFATSRVAKALEVADDWREKRGLEKAIEDENHGFQRQIVWQFIFRGKLPPPSDEDHRRLAASLSQERRQTFERAKTNDERARVVNAWIMGTMSFRRGWGGPSHEDLQKELDKLSPDERQRISTLPPEQMRDALRRKWWESRFNRGRPGGRGDRGPGDRPPGPPPGPPDRGGRSDGDRNDGDRQGDDGKDGRRGERRNDERRVDERRRDGQTGGRREVDGGPEPKGGDKPADQSGDQSGERPGGKQPAEGDAAFVRRALIRTYGAT
ncbi:MAG: hypothetical protein WD875_15635 [Pirellulales bacterium]